MKNPLISVVLGSYNRLDFLPLTIASIRKELAGTPHEIIVVDGGSDDGSVAWLCQQKDIVTIVQHNRGEWNGKQIERRSWGYFMNLGFKAAQGTYVCMLSDDCLLVPGAIVNGYKHAQEQIANGRKVGAVAFYWRDWTDQGPYHVGYTLGDKMYVNHGMYLKKALEEVQYIDEETCFFYNGDGDLCLKMWHQGYQVIDSPDSYVEHYPYANQAVRKTNYERYNQDVSRYLAKWDGIFYDKKKNNLGKVVEKEFIDRTKSGDIFAVPHNVIVTQNPAIIKQKTWFSISANELKWKYKALVRKVSALVSKD